MKFRQAIIDFNQTIGLQIDPRESVDVLLSIISSKVRPFNSWILDSWKGNLLLLTTSNEALETTQFNMNSLATLTSNSRPLSSDITDNFNFEMEIELFVV